MIYKNGGTNIPFLGRIATVNRHEARSGANKLINADNFARLSCTADVFPVAGTLIAPLLSSSLTIGTTRANRWIDGCKILRDESCTIHITKDRKAKMS